MATRTLPADVFDGEWPDVTDRLSVPADRDLLSFVLISLFWTGGWGVAAVAAARVSSTVDVVVLGMLAALPFLLLWGSG